MRSCDFLQNDNHQNDTQWKNNQPIEFPALLSVILWPVLKYFMIVNYMLKIGAYIMTLALSIIAKARIIHYDSRIIIYSFIVLATVSYCHYDRKTFQYRPTDECHSPKYRHKVSFYKLSFRKVSQCHSVVCLSAKCHSVKFHLVNCHSAKCTSVSFFKVQYC